MSTQSKPRAAAKKKSGALETAGLQNEFSQNNDTATEVDSKESSSPTGHANHSEPFEVLEAELLHASSQPLDELKRGVLIHEWARRFPGTNKAELKKRLEALRTIERAKQKKSAVLISIEKDSIDPLSSSSQLPIWGVFKAPDPYELRTTGVFFVEQNSDDPKSFFVCNPLWTRGLTRSSEGSNWGISLEFIALDGAIKKIAIKRAQLHESGKVLAQELADRGLRILPGNEERLLRYLDLCLNGDMIECVDKLGWSNGDTLEYVLDTEVIGGGSLIAFQPENNSPVLPSSRGTHQEWLAHVAATADQNSLLTVVSCLSLTGPFLESANSESFGIHLWGLSSKGKTTAAQFAASHWGNGSDPATSSGKSFLLKWNATINAIEALCASRNDNVLILDEIGTSAQSFTTITYSIFGGTGKYALNASRGLKKPRSWRLVAFSTGELSFAAKIESSPIAGLKQEARGGQTARMLDLEIDDSDLNEDQVKSLKDNCGKYFGSVGPELARVIVTSFATKESLSRFLKTALAQAKQHLLSLCSKQPSTRQVRALEHFALLLVAGQFASEKLIIPQSSDFVKQSIGSFFLRWLGSDGACDDTERAISKVREWLSDNQMSRFKERPGTDSNGNPRPTSDDGKIVHHFAGYKDHAAFYLTEEAFKEACGGLYSKAVPKLLDEKQFLLKDGGRGGRLKFRLVTENGRPSFYAIRRSILSSDEHSQSTSTQISPFSGPLDQQSQNFDAAKV